MTRTLLVPIGLFAVMATALAQQPAFPAAPPAPAAVAAGLEPARTDALNDLENLARTKSELFRERLNLIVAEALKQPEMVALQKEANEIAARANDALVKAAGKSPDTHQYDFSARKVVEKPKPK